MNKAAKKRSGRVALAVLCILLAALCIAAYILREVIYLAYSGTTSSEEAIASKQEENNKKTHEILDKIADIAMRDLTEEERQMLADGRLSYEDAMKLIMGETLAPATTASAPETTNAPEVTSPPVTEEAYETVDVSVTVAVTEKEEVTTVLTEVTVAETTACVTTAMTEPDKAQTNTVNIQALKNRQNEIIAEIYLLRARYLNEIDELIKNSKAEYVALPKEKHNMSGKLEMVEKVIIPKGNALEAECDAELDVLLLELEGILESLGDDKSLIAEIEDAYVEQKRLKKTELINTYMPK